MRVLYLEDNAIDADLTRQELGRVAPDVELSIVPTVADALAQLSQMEAGIARGEAPLFDVVLLDMALPDGNGLSVLARARNRSLPLAAVVLTGTGDEESVLAALRAGANDYQPKRHGYWTQLPATLRAALTSFRTQAVRRARPLRLLYVEPNAQDVHLTQLHFAKHAPFLLMENVGTAAEALERLPRSGLVTDLDVLLLDYRLPGVDALELLKEICQVRRLDIPIILATGHGSEDIALQAMKLGALDYIVKSPGYLYRLPSVVESAYYRAAAQREGAALRQSERRLRTILDSEPECVKLLGPGCTLLEMNPAGLQMIEADSLDQVVGQSVLGLILPDYRSAFADLSERVLQGQSGSVEFEILGIKGTRRWLETRAVPLRDEQGQVTSVLGVTRDITGAKQAERALRASEERFRELAETIQEVFWITDPAKTQMLYISPAYETIWGRTCESLYASPRTWLDAIHENDRERVLQAALHQQAAGTYDEEYRILRPDGSVRWIRDRAFPVRDNAGDIQRIVGLASDITERVQLEVQLRQAQKMESVGRLAGGIAHDFNNLLTVINGQAELAIASLPEEDPLRRDLLDIHKAGERAATLTRQLLAFSRRQVLQPQTINLNEVILGTEGMLRRLIGEDIQLITAFDPDLGSVQADPGQIEQVVMNLALNSRDAMPTGGKLWIETANVDLDAEFASQHFAVQPGSYVRLAITDTGCGMDATTQAQIFEPFFTTKEPGKGTGLGLATVYGIVKQSGGDLWVYSELNKGTTFKIYLPRDHSGQNRGPQAISRQSGAHGDETILLVEDEETVRKLASRVLTAAGYTVHAAANGAEALQICEDLKAPIHLVLTDVVMPRMSGRELVERLSSIRPGLRVLYTSGYTDDAIVHHGILDAGTQFIAKPFNPAALAQKVRETLDT